MDWSELNNFQYACIYKLGLYNLAYLSVKDIDLWLGLICEKPENDFLLAQTQRCKLIKLIFKKALNFKF